MAGSADARRRLDTLAQVGLRLMRSAPSGRVLLAQLAIGLDPAWLTGPAGEELLAEMRAAQATAVEPLAFKRIESSLRSAWGGRPGDELEDLDRAPVAVTPTSQVHRGTLAGAPVAVKVLRPGLARTVGQDLALLDSLRAPLGAAFPALDAGGVLREAAERVRDELDLEHEAGAQRRFHRALRGHASLAVPAPITRLCHADVLVSEWVEGTPLSLAPPADVDAAAAGLVRFVLGGAASLGMMHAGLTPDDVRLLPDGRIAVLDFGVCAEVNRERLAGAAAAMRALLDDDVTGWAAALSRFNWLAEGEAPAALALLRGGLGELVGPDPVRLDAAAVLAVRERMAARSETGLALLRSGALAPVDVWPARGAAQLFATLARVRARGRFAEIAHAALVHGWD